MGTFTPEQIEYLNSHYVKVNDCKDNRSKLDKEVTDIKAFSYNNIFIRSQRGTIREVAYGLKRA